MSVEIGPTKAPELRVCSVDTVSDQVRRLTSIQDAPNVDVTSRMFNSLIGRRLDSRGERFERTDAVDSGGLCSHVAFKT